MFSTNVMDEQTMLFQTHKYTIKSNSRNTDWIVDLFQQVKSAEHIAKINT